MLYLLEGRVGSVPWELHVEHTPNDSVVYFPENSMNSYVTVFFCNFCSNRPIHRKKKIGCSVSISTKKQLGKRYQKFSENFISIWLILFNRRFMLLLFYCASLDTYERFG